MSTLLVTRSSPLVSKIVPRIAGSVNRVAIGGICEGVAGQERPSAMLVIVMVAA